MTPDPDPKWPRFQEPLRSTLARTVVMAVVIGGVLAVVFPRRFGGLTRWPIITLLALWPTLGGHLVELWFLNGPRPRLPSARPLQAAVRVVVWFVGGSVLGLAMWMTATLAGFQSQSWPAWWLGGIAFIAIELTVHLVLQLRGKPSFYNGRG